MEEVPKTEFPDATNLSKGKSGFKILVPLQDINLSKTLLPPAIRAAKRHSGKIILLNIIEIPYQLPPSEAEQFKLEREFKLQFARQIIETAGCDLEIMVRIAHRLPFAIEQLAESLDIDLIIMWARNKGLLWAKEIYQELYAVNSDLLVAKERVGTHFSDVIIQIDDLQTATDMMEHATYLMGSDKGNFHIVQGHSSMDEQLSLNKLKSIVVAFQHQSPWFRGNIVFPQLQSVSAAKKYLNDIYCKGTGSTGALFSYPSGLKLRADNWFRDVAKELNVPVFISKVGQVVPMGNNEITNSLKKWVGISS